MKEHKAVFCVALTGTIASGKSTVAALFKELGIEVISADEINKELTAPQSAAFSEILQHFGSNLKTAQGFLDRRALRERIFASPEERIWLEKLLHPLIRKRIQDLIHRSQSPYCMVEIPLLFNRGDYPYIQRVLLVSADIEFRIQRIMARDHHTREEALSIITAQAQDQEYQAISDDIIINNNLISDVKKQVAKLHSQYLHWVILKK